MTQRNLNKRVTHDPALIKPYADYHRRENPLVIIQPAAYPVQPNPPVRKWTVAQCVPLVQDGLARNGTHAAALLNLSWLPETSSPEMCLEWVRALRGGLESGASLGNAARAADRLVLGSG